jgi:hypothetical protein
MDNAAFVTLQDVANIVTFVAPGYFAIQVYSLVYAKKERDFSRLLIESIVYSLPIVTLANVIWRSFSQETISSLSMSYAALVFAIALLSGAVVTFLRTRSFVLKATARIGLGSPDEDFVKTQLLRIDVKDPEKSAVTVKLKTGAVFSGTVDRLSRYAYGGPMYYYFANLAWFNEATGRWNKREGGILVERSEIEYIETPKLSNKL